VALNEIVQVELQRASGSGWLSAPAVKGGFGLPQVDFAHRGFFGPVRKAAIELLTVRRETEVVEAELVRLSLADHHRLISGIISSTRDAPYGQLRLSQQAEAPLEPRRQRRGPPTRILSTFFIFEYTYQPSRTSSKSIIPSSELAVCFQ